MTVCLNEDLRLTKDFLRQLPTEPEILVTPSSKALPISYLLYFISNSEEAFNKNLEMTVKHDEWSTGVLNDTDKLCQILKLLLYSCICMDRFHKNSIFRIRSNMAYYIT